jgi:hypothetical protein
LPRLGFGLREPVAVHDGPIRKKVRFKFRDESLDPPEAPPVAVG